MSLGIKIPHEDPQALADAILQMVNSSPTQQKARSEKALHSVQHYSWKIIAEKKLKQYAVSFST